MISWCGQGQSYLYLLKYISKSVQNFMENFPVFFELLLVYEESD